MDGEDDGVGILHDRDVEVLDLLTDVGALVVDAGLGEARQVHELQVRVVGRLDVQEDWLFADVVGAAHPLLRPPDDLRLNTIKTIQPQLIRKSVFSEHDAEYVVLIHLMQPKAIEMAQSVFTLLLYLTSMGHFVTMSLPRGRNE